MSTLAHSAQPAAALMTELRLSEHGLELIDPDPYLFAPLPDGRSLLLGRDVDATASNIAKFSSNDARRYPEFCATLASNSPVRRQRDGEHAAGDRTADARRSVVDAADGPAIPWPGKERCLPPAAMGADVGGRFRVGVVRVGTVARRTCGSEAFSEPHPGRDLRGARRCC